MPTVVGQIFSSKPEPLASTTKERDALEAWLPRAGSIANARMRWRCWLQSADFIATDPPPFEPNFTFERTEVWDLDYEAAHGLPQSIENGTDALPVQDILDELRLIPSDYGLVQREALARALSIRTARRQGIEAGADEKERVLRTWLRERGTGFAKLSRTIDLAMRNWTHS